MPPKEQKNPLGPTGWTVVRNVRELREARGMTYKELSDRLLALGRPIPPLGLSRMEKGERRVDADDLMALALALRVNVSALLLPRDVSAHEEIQLTPERHQRAWIAWLWTAGRIPMPNEVIDEKTEEHEPEDDEFGDFHEHALPTNMAPKFHVAVRAAHNLARKIELLLWDPGPINLDRRIFNIRRAFRRARVEVDDLLAEVDPEGRYLYDPDGTGRPRRGDEDDD